MMKKPVLSRVEGPVLHNREGAALCTVKALLLSTAALAGFASSSAHAQTSPSAYTSATRYDGVNRVTGTIAPDPDGGGALNYAAVRNTYSSSGNLIKVETGELSSWQSESVAPSAWSGFTVLSSVETSYDIMGRKTKDVAKGSDGNPVSVTQYSYDSAGRLECTAVRMNPSVYGSLPASACTLGTEGSQGKDRITRQSYDAAGQLLVVQKAYGTALQQDYVTYTYTNNGKQASVKDANGNLASLTYDGHDRLVQWNFPSKTSIGSVSTTDYEQYGYDANGNKTTYRKRDGSTLTYTYDALNRMTVKTVPERSGLSSTHTRDVYYGYDLRGLQLYARYDSTSGEGVSSTYDGFGRLASSSLTIDGATRTLSYQRDKDGNRTELTWPDSNKTSYSYDGLDRMGTLYEGGIGSTVNMLTYGYNNRGLRSSQTGRYGQSTSFSYDAVGRLNSFGHDFAGTSKDVSYGATFTPASQIATRTTSNDAYAWTGAVSVSRSYAVNGLNQYTSVGGGAITYDDNGNLTSSNSITYQYDVENRLVAASGAISASLRYDPLGRLYEVTGSSGTTRFLYDGDELVAEYNTSGTLLRRYAHGTSVDDPVVWYEGASIGPARWLHTNWQGSVVAVTDASGSSIVTNSYDEWGIPAATNQGRFQYTGQAWLPEIGMYYYKARIYSPTLGRFMQTDPIGYDDQINLYAYVANDPVNAVDPDGKKRVFDSELQNTQPKTPDIVKNKQNAAKFRKEQAQKRDKADRAATGSEITGLVASAQQVIEHAASKTPGGGAGALKVNSGLLTVAAAGMDLKSQIDRGKDSGAAIANVEGKVVLGLVAGAVGSVAGPVGTIGLPIVADRLAGSAVGRAMENRAQLDGEHLRKYGPLPEGL